MAQTFISFIQHAFPVLFSEKSDQRFFKIRMCRNDFLGVIFQTHVTLAFYFLFAEYDRNYLIFFRLSSENWKAEHSATLARGLPDECRKPRHGKEALLYCWAHDLTFTTYLLPINKNHLSIKKRFSQPQWDWTEPIHRLQIFQTNLVITSTYISLIMILFAFSSVSSLSFSIVFLSLALFDRDLNSHFLYSFFYFWHSLVIAEVQKTICIHCLNYRIVNILPSQNL